MHDGSTSDLPLCIYCGGLRDALSREAFPRPWPCVGCGKMLRHIYGHHFAETFCSVACEDVVYARREQRHERKRRRLDGIACASCGFVFKPKRRGNAVTCSSACRQRMYRQRVTDSSILPRLG